MTPYPMKRDSRIGPEHWSGCHSFTDIIYDGQANGLHQPRHGGLKMGGMYWVSIPLYRPFRKSLSKLPAFTNKVALSCISPSGSLTERLKRSLLTSLVLLQAR